MTSASPERLTHGVGTSPVPSEHLTYGWSKPVVLRNPGRASEHWWPPKATRTYCGPYTTPRFAFMEVPEPGIGNHPCGRCFNAWKRWVRRESLGK